MICKHDSDPDEYDIWWWAQEKRLVLTTEDLSLALREVWNSTYFKCFVGSTINTVVAEYTHEGDG